MNRRLYQTLALLLLLIAAVVGARVVMKKSGHTMGDQQHPRHQLLPKDARTARQSRRSGKIGMKDILSQRAFNQLWEIGEADVEGEELRDVSNEMSYFTLLKVRGKKKVDIEVLMKRVDFQQARVLFDRFDGEGFCPENIARYEPLASFLAYRAAERMAEIDPEKTLAFFRKKEKLVMDHGRDRSLEGAVVLGWSRNDPAAAAKWWRVTERGRVDPSTLFYDTAVDQEVYRRFAKVDYVAAMKLASEAKLTNYQANLYAAVIDGMPESVDMAQFAAVDLVKMLDEIGRDELENEFIQMLFVHSPAEEIKQAVAIKWLMQDTDAALKWYEAEEHETVTIRDLDKLKSMVRNWAEKDPQSFMTWAKSQGGEVRGLSHYFGRDQAPTSLTYISQLPDAENRMELVKGSIEQGLKNGNHIIINWLQEGDENAASSRYYQQQIEYVSSSSLQPDEKKEVIQWLKTKRIDRSGKMLEE